MDYKNGKIYKLVCSETQNIYIGSTCSTLVKRLHQHKRKYNNCMSKTFIEPKIYLVEDFPCDRKEQLTGRERYYIETLDCVNKVIPGRTKKEYYQENKEKIYKREKEYRKKNKEKVAQRKKEYYQANKEILNKKKKISYEKNKEKYLKQQKEYCQKNKEKIALKKKEYREKNKDKIKKKYTCECGSVYVECKKKRHEASQKHLNYIINNSTGMSSDDF